MASSPQVTVVVPSLNQARYLEDALNSIAAQDVATEIVVVDGGSADGARQILERWSNRLTYWRTSQDAGQAAAINEGVSRGVAPYVSWLNSDDMLEPRGLRTLVHALETNPRVPAAYGNVSNLHDGNGWRNEVWVEPFAERSLAVRCIVSQPGALVRRSAWEAVGGLDSDLLAGDGLRSVVAALSAIWAGSARAANCRRKSDTPPHQNPKQSSRSLFRGYRRRASPLRPRSPQMVVRTTLCRLVEGACGALR